MRWSCVLLVCACVNMWVIFRKHAMSDRGNESHSLTDIYGDYDSRGPRNIDVSMMVMYETVQRFDHQCKNKVCTVNSRLHVAGSLQRMATERALQRWYRM